MIELTNKCFLNRNIEIIMDYHYNGNNNWLTGGLVYHKIKKINK